MRKSEKERDGGVGGGCLLEGEKERGGGREKRGVEGVCVRGRLAHTHIRRRT